MDTLRTTTEGGFANGAKEVKAFGTQAAEEQLQPLKIKRRKPASHDVEIEIMFCGVCHSDLHTARNEWHGTIYPCVPGHEIVGRVVAIGEHVSKFQVGDLAAVGCMVDSCRECDNCAAGLEQYCETGNTGTYNAPDIHLGTRTYGGYSESIVVNEDFVLHVPANLD
ncbi:MAG: alcohol dehydrogenase catalytic domain-containing protein, partial [Saprospiraceae bacterium]